MKTAIKNAKKTLAVLLSVLMLCSFGTVFVGAEGAIKWDTESGGYSLTVPKSETDVETLTLPEATAEGIEGAVSYELVLLNGENETDVPVKLFGFKTEKPEIKVGNNVKKYVSSNDLDRDGSITLGMRAICGEVKSALCSIKIENVKVKATFSYIDKTGSEAEKTTEVFYGASAKGFADGIDDREKVKNDEFFHYDFKGWVAMDGSESTVESVVEDTVFAPSIVSEAHHWVKDEKKSEDETCTTPGKLVEKCEGCNRERTTPVPAGHKWVEVEPGIPATCTKDGKTPSYRCERCEETKKSEPIFSRGHTPVVDPAVPATCTAPGKTAGSHCAVCGEVIDPQNPVGEALGHDKVQHDAKAPTCTEVGWDAYETCSRCSEYTTYVEKPALGHLIDETDESTKIEAVPATCLAAGHTEGYRCKREGCDYTTCETIEKLSHTKTDIKTAVEPTCTATGLTEGYTCSVCHTVVEQEVVPMIPHTEVVIPAVPATCTETGLKEGKRCSVCETVTVPQEVVPALDHDWKVTKEGTPATCTEKGISDEKTCLRCKTVEPQVQLAPLGHVLVTEYGRDATCTEDGLTDKIFCSRCNEVIQEAKEIPNLGGHKDLDNDGFCDHCGTVVEKPQPSHQCGCMCHKKGFVGWLWKNILCPICKFLGIEQDCACGIKHWTK